MAASGGVRTATEVGGDHRWRRAYLRFCAAICAVIAAGFTVAAFVVPPLALGAVAAVAGVIAAVHAARSPLDHRRPLTVLTVLHVAAGVYAFTALGAGGSADRYEPGAVQVVFVVAAVVLVLAGIGLAVARGRTS